MTYRFRLLIVVLLFLLLTPFFGESRSDSPVPVPLRGIWENADRFVEFTEDGMRIVLKTYYGFVYESFPLIAVEPRSTVFPFPSGDMYSLSLRYPRDRNTHPFTVARTGDSLFLDFLVRLPDFPAESGSPLDGAWLPGGSLPALRLYPVNPGEDFFVFVFSGSRYFRVRYWKTDARERDVYGQFTDEDRKIRLPKFLRIDGVLYTCITGTGTRIRNFETGHIVNEEETLRFEPDRIVYAGTAAAWRHPIPYTLNGDILVLGEPYLVRSNVTDLDSAVTAHNAKRRPRRKPIFEFMELDFHWDEVERLRGNILDR